ncbi:DNA repair protein RecO [Candidatus Saccharibacteria bacterium]|nr:DNA repair protein RecO [Candidatus Saccharibacteria bacterium]
MQTSRTLSIILRRINYGEADRILTLLTRDFGKQTVIAKGVRKEKSKLAGGIELFSESDISFIKGKGEVGTLVSTKLNRHFGNIHIDMDRMQAVSAFLKQIDAVTEQEAGKDFYDLALDVFIYMNTKEINPRITKAWALMRLMLLIGEVVNVESDSSGKKFSDEMNYKFIFEENRFIPDPNGLIKPGDIKFLRFLGTETPARLMAIKNSDELSKNAFEVLDLSYRYSRPARTH